MGARHPQATISKLSANKNEFILAAKYLIKQGIVKSPGDAIRYMDEHNTNVSEIVEQIITSKQTQIIQEEPEQEDE